MARGIHRLSAVEVKAKTKPGHYADGGGLYLQVSKWGTRSWVFKFTLGGRTRGMGLGPIDEISLKKAREEVERLAWCAQDDPGRQRPISGSSGCLGQQVMGHPASRMP